ncbi:MAG: hypothetical protein V4440_14825, partial [Pseudomonadota bacterium]
EQSSPEESSLTRDLGRQAGLTARIGIEGLSDIGAMAINAAGSAGRGLINATPLGKPLGLAADAIQNQVNPNHTQNADKFSQTMSQGGTRVADMIGLPKPETAAERVVNTTGRVMMPTGAAIQGGNMVSKAASPAAQRIAKFLSAAPAQQVVGAVGAGLGSSTAKEMGASEPMQVAAGVAGGLGLSAAAGTVNKAFNTGSLALQPTDALGKTSLRQRNAQSAIDQGYVLPPSNTDSGVISKTLEGLSGKEKTLQLASVKNQKVTDNLAKDYINIPRDTELNTQTLNSAKEPFNEVYEKIASLPAIKRTGKFAEGESLSGKQTLEQLKTTRYDARMQWNYFNRSGDPEAFAKANLLDEQAKGIEKKLESIAMSAKQPELVQDLRNARKELAKIYTVEKSLNPETGNVDAKAVLKLKQKGAPIDGPLGKVAKTAEAFPDAMRVPKTGYNVPFTAWDWTFGGIGSTINPAALAIPAARVGARYGVLSKAGQKAINSSKPKNGVPLSTVYGLGAVDDGDDNKDNQSR